MTTKETWAGGDFGREADPYGMTTKGPGTCVVASEELAVADG